MKRKKVILAVLLCLLPVYAEAAEPEVVSVDFYPSGARFVFQLLLEQAGDFEFTLPVTFLTESVRSLQRGVGSMRVEVVPKEEHEEEAQEEEAQEEEESCPELAALERAATEKRIETLEKTAAEKRREIRLLNGRINAVNHALRMIYETVEIELSGRMIIGNIDKVINAIDRTWEKRLQYEMALADHEIEKENAQREYRKILEEMRALRSELGRGESQTARQTAPQTQTALQNTLHSNPPRGVLRYIPRSMPRNVPHDIPRNNVPQDRRPNEPQIGAYVLRVRGTASTAGPILFEARTNNARWSVRYEINLNSETGQINTVMHAMASQETGLDVKGSFTFHSRTPSLSMTAPALPPLMVRLAVPSHPLVSGADINRFDMLRGIAPTSLAMSPAVTAPEVESMAAIPMQVRDIISTLANVSVRGNGRIKGDGVLTSVELGEFEFPGTVRLIAIPELNREAWIVADLDEVPDAFLPGPATLYVDGVASGRTNIADFGLQGTLPFGMAQRVTVEKRRSAGVTGTTWLGRTGTLQNGFTIKVTNNMNTEQEIEVRDRLPLSADDRITMESVRINPAPVYQDDENRLTWRLTLAPGETRRIYVEYTIRYPGGETLDL